MEKTSSERDKIITALIGSGDDKLLGSEGTHLLILLLFSGSMSTTYKGIGKLLGIHRTTAAAIVNMGVDMGWFKLQSIKCRKFILEADLPSRFRDPLDTDRVTPITEFKLTKLFEKEELAKHTSVV